MAGLLTGPGLPAPNRGVHIAGIEFQAIADPAGAFSRHEAGPATQERIQDHVAPARRIQNRIRHQRDGFDGRVKGEEIPFLARSTKGIDARVPPDVRAIAAESAQLDVISMGSGAVLEYKHKLVLATGENE